MLVRSGRGGEGDWGFGCAEEMAEGVLSLKRGNTQRYFF